MVSRLLDSLKNTGRQLLRDPALLVGFIPLFVAISYSTRDIRWLVGASTLIPFIVLAFRAMDVVNSPKGGHDALTGLPSRAALLDVVDRYFATPGASTRTAACLVIDIDEFHSFNERWGRDAGDEVLRQTAQRLRSAVREDDLVVRLDADAYALYLAPSQGMTLDSILSIGDRIQRALSEPVVVHGTTAYVSASVGIALASKSPEPTAASLLVAAERAMVEARSHGAGALRLFSSEMQTEIRASHELAEDLAKALENGEIVAWFQPQVSTETGQVTGFEALARWEHPTRGTVSPAEFLPAIEATGRTERLSEVMLYQGLKALVAWERGGFAIPNIGVNFAGMELRNPHLIDKVKWELDRFGLTADRLSVEILESVISQTEDDIILRNISALGELGCGIDLDDFGTGHASISSIKQFRINRIKIDRSFVTHVDKDGEQQRMVAAILTMAQQLGLDALAEGVETIGEHSLLGQLGCHHVQGYGIARPMPFEDTFAWLEAHNAKLAPPPRIERQQGH